jgi:hypothetical protein
VASEKQDSGAKISQIIIMVQMTANQVQNQVMQYTSSAKVLPSFAEESPSFAEELPSFAEYFFLRRLGHRVFTEIPKPQNPKTPTLQIPKMILLCQFTYPILFQFFKFLQKASQQFLLHRQQLS